MSDREVILACVPELDGARLELWGEGDFVRAYRGRGRLVRVPKHAAARAALDREACLLPYLAGRVPVPVPVPRVATSDTGRHAVAVHDALPGEELWKERWQGLAEPDRRRLAARTGAFLRMLHDLDPDPVRPCGLAETTPRDLGIRIGQQLASREWPVLPGLQPSLARCLAELQAGGEGTKRAVLHGDFGPGHTLFDPVTLELTGIIDWGDAFIGEPARDFIFVYEDWGEPFLRLAVAAYAPARPARFLERIYLHYLADQLRWILERPDGSTEADVAGVEGLKRALEDLRRLRAQG
jgi:aminoglycoside 2''-phosphotransferase